MSYELERIRNDISELKNDIGEAKRESQITKELIVETGADLKWVVSTLQTQSLKISELNEHFLKCQICSGGTELIAKIENSEKKSSKALTISTIVLTIVFGLAGAFGFHLFGIGA